MTGKRDLKLSERNLPNDQTLRMACDMAIQLRAEQNKKFDMSETGLRKLCDEIARILDWPPLMVQASPPSVGNTGITLTIKNPGIEMKKTVRIRGTNRKK